VNNGKQVKTKWRIGPEKEILRKALKTALFKEGPRRRTSGSVSLVFKKSLLSFLYGVNERRP
jgi:hypothetical protein